MPVESNARTKRQKELLSRFTAALGEEAEQGEITVNFDGTQVHLTEPNGEFEMTVDEFEIEIEGLEEGDEDEDEGEAEEEETANDEEEEAEEENGDEEEEVEEPTPAQRRREEAREAKRKEREEAKARREAEKEAARAAKEEEKTRRETERAEAQRQADEIKAREAQEREQQTQDAQRLMADVNATVQTMMESVRQEGRARIHVGRDLDRVETDLNNIRSLKQADLNAVARAVFGPEITEGLNLKGRGAGANIALRLFKREEVNFPEKGERSKALGVYRTFCKGRDGDVDTTYSHPDNVDELGNPRTDDAGNPSRVKLSDIDMNKLYAVLPFAANEEYRTRLAIFCHRHPWSIVSAAKDLMRLDENQDNVMEVLDTINNMKVTQTFVDEDTGETTEVEVPATPTEIKQELGKRTGKSLDVKTIKIEGSLFRGPWEYTKARFKAFGVQVDETGEVSNTRVLDFLCRIVSEQNMPADEFAALLQEEQYITEEQARPFIEGAVGEPELEDEDDGTPDDE